MGNIFLYPLEIFFVLKFTMFDVNMDYNLLLISAITYVYHYIWSESTVDNLELILFFFFDHGDECAETTMLNGTVVEWIM